MQPRIRRDCGGEGVPLLTSCCELGIAGMAFGGCARGHRLDRVPPIPGLLGLCPVGDDTLLSGDLGFGRRTDPTAGVALDVLPMEVQRRRLVTLLLPVVSDLRCCLATGIERCLVTPPMFVFPDFPSRVGVLPAVDFHLQCAD